MNFIVPRIVKEKKKVKILRPFNSTITAKITDINNFGLMKVSFNRTVFSLFNYSEMLNASNIDIWLAPANNWHLEKEGYN